MSHDAQLQRFVRGLLAGGAAARKGEVYVARDGQRVAAPMVLELVSSGALGGDGESCFAVAETRAWLKRARLDADAFAAQHRVTTRDADGAEINLAESPLARLASAGAGEAFLDRHHVEAGERVRRLVERAQLQPRLTMAYSASRTAGGPRPQAVADISDLAAEARREMAMLHRVLPRDCAGVVLDVCGLLKGLQEVERDRGWPRRSAKLVLRIGLEQLAQHYGFGPFAIGRASHAPRGWMEPGARPERFE